MNKINDGGPAFPFLWNCAHNSEWQTESGMTLRDWFAGQALSGMLANGFRPDEGLIQERSSYDFDTPEEYKAALPENSYATVAYRVADAMLAARDKAGEA